MAPGTPYRRKRRSNSRFTSSTVVALTSLAPRTYRLYAPAPSAAHIAFHRLSPPTLEVDRPHVVSRLGHHVGRPLKDADRSLAPSSAHLAEPLQDAGDGGPA